MQLVADANVLLSAAIGGRAALVLRHKEVEQIFAPVVGYDEVFEYLGPLAKKRRLRLTVMEQFPVTREQVKAVLEFAAQSLDVPVSGR